MPGDVTPGRNMEAVTIRNVGDDPPTSEVDVYRLKQEYDRDLSAPAENFLVVPPIVTIRPDRAQYLPGAVIVHLGRFCAPLARELRQCRTNLRVSLIDSSQSSMENVSRV